VSPAKKSPAKKPASPDSAPAKAAKGVKKGASSKKSPVKATAAKAIKTSVAKTAPKKAVKPASKPTPKKVPLSQRRLARKMILQALYQWLIAQADTKEIESQFREEATDKVDWVYFKEIFYAIPKQVDSLEAQFQPLLDRKITALDPIEKALLYLGTYELAHRIDVPYRVVINECVELAKIFGATESHKYINGILDKLAASLREVEIKAYRKKS